MNLSTNQARRVAFTSTMTISSTQWTPFDLPANASPPPALELDETIKDQIVYLALPLRQPGLVEAGGADATDATLRYRSRTEDG